MAKILTLENRQPPQIDGQGGAHWRNQTGEIFGSTQSASSALPIATIGALLEDH